MCDKKSLFLGWSVGDFALCVKGKADALCGRPSFWVEIRSLRRRNSEVGKVDLGPYIREKGDIWPEKGYTSPLNSPPLRGVGPTSRRPIYIGHPFLREGCTDNVSCQVFHSLFLFAMNPWSAKDIEPRMTPFHEHVNQVFRDFSLGEKDLEDLVPEDLFQSFCVNTRRYTEHLFTIKTSV